MVTVPSSHECSHDHKDIVFILCPGMVTWSQPWPCSHGHDHNHNSCHMYMVTFNIMCLNVIIVANGFGHQVIAFLLSKLEPTQERSRISTLNIMKHLINSCGTCGTQNICPYNQLEPLCAKHFYTTSEGLKSTCSQYCLILYPRLQCPLREVPLTI